MAASQISGAMADVYKQVQSRIPETVSLPPRLLSMYEDFITRNSGSVSQIESALSSLTYIIPGRFRESELASESLHSSIQLLSLYHTTILSRAFCRLPSSIPRLPLSPHNRYTKFWIAHSHLYRRTAHLLQVLQYTELLCEMAAKRRGNKIRWRVVVFLEMVKAVCRFVLMRLTNSRPLVTPPLPEREADPRTIEGEDKKEDRWDGMQTPPSEKDVSGFNFPWIMPRTGLTLPTLPDSTDISTYLLKKVLTADDIKAPKALLHRLTTAQGHIAETLWILRPVIYALSMQHWQGHKKSWSPWLIGASIEIAARQLAKKDLSEKVAGGWRGLTGLEREELKRRGWGMGWWVMRGAFYENVTRPWIQSLISGLQGKPLLDMVGGVVDDYDYLWDEYYFPTATM